MLNFP